MPEEARRIALEILIDALQVFVLEWEEYRRTHGENLHSVDVDLAGHRLVLAARTLAVALRTERRETLN